MALAIFATTFVGGSAANASSTPQDNAPIAHFSSSPAVSAEEISQIEIAQASVDLTSSPATFDYAEAVNSGVTTENAGLFASGFDAIGGSILSGPFALPALSGEMTASVQALADCGGRNAFGTYWWGMQVAMNSCVTNTVMGAIGVAGGAVIIAGALSWIGAVPAALIGGLMAIGAGAIAICASWGNGIYANVLWAGAPFCWGE